MKISAVSSTYDTTPNKLYGPALSYKKIQNFELLSGQIQSALQNDEIPSNFLFMQHTRTTFV